MDTDFDSDLELIDKSTQESSSYIDLFKQEVAELEQIKDVLIPVAGFEKTGVQVKYRLPKNGHELDEIARRAKREANKDTFAMNMIISMQTMITLCEGVYVQPPEADEPVMLDPDNAGYPVKFDERLGELLGLDPSNSTARQTLKKLFGNNDSKIIDHSERLGRWVRNTKADITAEIWQLGE